MAAPNTRDPAWASASDRHPTPYAHMQADELADEIAVARECIQTTRDLRVRRQMQDKLKELLAEEGRRQTHEDLPL